MAERALERFTAEQAAAIQRRAGELALHAGAGAGKTAVLVERFVRSVTEDGIEVGRLLCITFTEKAAGELRQRIRARLAALGADEPARAIDAAWISTIHGFCARVLRAHALAAGLDPAFEILDADRSAQLAEESFEEALEELAAARPDAARLIASHSPAALQTAIIACHAQLRARGQRRPSLPPLGSAPDCAAALRRLARARSVLAAELGAITAPGKRVQQALQRLARCGELLGDAATGGGEPLGRCAPGGAGLALAELEAVALPGGNGAALASAAAQSYSEALAGARAAREHQLAAEAHALLGELLGRFGARYAERKRQGAGVDFEDLELLCARLLERQEIAARYRERFQRVMVDEMQDTNAVQLALIERIASGRLFTVGDAQQAIYGFRHADVELFARHGERLAARGARASLQVNFRSRPELLERINDAFATLIDGHRPLRAGRPSRGAERPGAVGRGPDGDRDACAVALLIADKGAEWESEGLAAPWRPAEARALAEHIAALVGAGRAPGEIVVLLRAATDMRLYEQALELAGVSAYTIGGRGYWRHPQVIDMLCYLRALANPCDEEALMALLVSPLVGASYDALVLAAAGARERKLGLWELLREPGDALEALAEGDRRQLARFAGWFAAERALAWRLGPAQLIERAIAHSGADLRVLAMRGGERRWANVLKLLRLAREHELLAGPDLPGFLALARRRAAGPAAGSDREGEAPVQGEALDAVALMTIHRAKGLEFEVVCVADLGRVPVSPAPLLQIGADGRFGVRVSEPGTDRTVAALAYDALAAQQRAREQAEERRLYYVAATRARERLILSGAMRLDAPGTGREPMSWLAPAFVPEIGSLAAQRRAVAANGVALWLARPADVTQSGEGRAAAQASRGETRPACWPPAPATVHGSPPACWPPAPATGSSPSGQPRPAHGAEPPGGLLPGSRAPATTLSYSALAEHRRCGLRFYVERVLGLAPVRSAEPPAAGEEGPWARPLDGGARGTLIHELLARLDLRRAPPEPIELAGALAPRCGEAQALEIAQLLARFAASAMRGRLARAAELLREQDFAFLLDQTLVRGSFDVLAREGPGRMLVVDYKSDRLCGRAPKEAFDASAYGAQRLIYAIAALRAGARRLQVAHVFLEAPESPVSAEFDDRDTPRLEGELKALCAGLLAGSYPVCDQPHVALCRDCPAAGGLCPHPPALTRRLAPRRLL